MTTRSRDAWAAPWGVLCRCGHAQLVHRGVRHDGECAAMRCATPMDARGLAKSSACHAFAPVPAPEPQNTWSAE